MTNSVILARPRYEIPPTRGAEDQPGGGDGTVEAKNARPQEGQWRTSAAMRASKAIKLVLRTDTSSDARNGSKNGHKPYRYSAFDLLRHGFSQADWPRAWRKH